MLRSLTYLHPQIQFFFKNQGDNLDFRGFKGGMRVIYTLGILVGTYEIDISPLLALK